MTTKAIADGAACAPGADPSRPRPLLQVALDFVDLPRALAVAREAVAGFARGAHTPITCTTTARSRGRASKSQKTMFW